jgi:hypothetical protein
MFFSHKRRDRMWYQTSHPIQRAQWAFSTAAYRPGRVYHHLPPSSFDVKEDWSCTSTPTHALIAYTGAALS